MDRRIQKTKSSIQQAYIDKIKEGSGHKITIAEIARLANIDRKTFYLHYESVDDILKDFCQERVEELVSRLSKTDFFENPMKLTQVFLILNDILERDMDFYRHLSSSNSYLFFWDQIQEIMVHALIKAYVDKITVSPADFQIYCTFFVSGIIRLYQDFLRAPESGDIEKRAAIIVDIAANGVLKLLRQD